MPSSTEKRFFRINKILFLCGRALTVLSIGWLLMMLFSNIQELSTIRIEKGTSSIFLLSLSYIMGTFAISAYVTQILLRPAHVFLSFKQAYIITGIPQVAKYLPGNIFHYVGQIALGRNAGIPSGTMLMTLIVHTFLLAATTGGVAIIGLWLDRSSLVWLIQELERTSVSVMMIVAVIAVFLGLVVIVIVFPKNRNIFARYAMYVHPMRAGIPVLLYVIVFIGYGIMIANLLGAFWEIETLLHWYHFTWGFTLAWVLGFVMPGAPGGLGIREMIFFGLYHQELGPGIVIGLSLIVRIITSIADLITFGIAYCIDRYWSETSLLHSH